MGKRQTRIFRHTLGKYLTGLPGQEVNILLNSQATFHGVVVQIEGEKLLLRDLRLREHWVALSAIEEITLDRETPW